MWYTILKRIDAKMLYKYKIMFYVFHLKMKYEIKNRIFGKKILRI